jgi:hypothetical protein
MRGLAGGPDHGSRSPHTAAFLILLGPWETEGGEHLAFAMSRAEFEAVFQTVRGRAVSPYFLDPNEHMIEIRHYE